MPGDVSVAGLQILGPLSEALKLLVEAGTVVVPWCFDREGARQLCDEKRTAGKLKKFGDTPHSKQLYFAVHDLTLANTQCPAVVQHISGVKGAAAAAGGGAKVVGTYSHHRPAGIGGLHQHKDKGSECKVVARASWGGPGLVAFTRGNEW